MEHQNNLPTTSWESITPMIARQMLEHNAVNRPVSNPTVRHYAMQMSKGQWALNGEAIVISDRGNLTNGQHRLNAVIIADEAVTFLVVRGVKEDTFSSFDGGKNRSLSDVMSLAQIKNATRISSMLQKRQALLLGQRMIGGSEKGGRGSFKDKKLSRQDYLNIYNANPTLFSAIANKAGAYYSRLRLFTHAEVGAVMCFLHIDKGHTLEEVYGLFDSLYEDGQNPCKSVGLLRALILRDMTATRSMTGEYKSQILVKAWNDYTDGNNGRKQLKWNKESEGKLSFK